jgi:hypothetical protein
MATATVRKPKRPARKAANMPIVKATKKKAAAKKDLTESYNQYKKFEGRQYTGMKVGRSHKWYYDKGEWKETKITPDLWEISYAVTKRRAGKAPEGSGVPVGTAYHWFILAHQDVRKLNANDYTTSMTGLKFKLAHKRFDHEKWNVSAKTQRKHLVAFLKEMIVELEKEPVPLEINYEGKTYKGEGMPISQTCEGEVCNELDISLNDEHFGVIRKYKSGWKMDQIKDAGLVKIIGEEIDRWYEQQ